MEPALGGGPRARWLTQTEGPLAEQLLAQEEEVIKKAEVEMARRLAKVAAGFSRKGKGRVGE